MPILHQFKLMTSNGFGMPLISFARIEEGYSANLKNSSPNHQEDWKERMN